MKVSELSPTPSKKGVEDDSTTVQGPDPEVETKPSCREGRSGTDLENANTSLIGEGPSWVRPTGRLKVKAKRTKSTLAILAETSPYDLGP